MSHEEQEQEGPALNVDMEQPKHAELEATKEDERTKESSNEKRKDKSTVDHEEDELLEMVEDAVDQEHTETKNEEKAEPKTQDTDIRDGLSKNENQEVLEKTDLGAKQNIVDLDDDLLEYGTPMPNEDEVEFVSETVHEIPETQDSLVEKYAKFPIILKTGNFPYLLTPLSLEAAKRLPSEYEDALSLFDDFRFGSTIYEVFQKIRTTFKELDNEFSEDDDLILNFKEFNLELKESSAYAHELTLLEIVQAFEALSLNLGPAAPACLHLELSCERSFISRFDDLLNLPERLEPKSAEELGLEGEGTENKPFELSAEELSELDESLSLEEPEKPSQTELNERTNNPRDIEEQPAETNDKNGVLIIEGAEEELLSLEPTIDPEEPKDVSAQLEKAAEGEINDEKPLLKRSLEESQDIDKGVDEDHKRQK